MEKKFSGGLRTMNMNIRKLSKGEFLEVLRDDGIIMGFVVMDFSRFVMRCQRYGFNSREFEFLF